MIKEMNKSLRLCRYAYGLTGNLWLMAAIFAGGVLSSFLVPAGSMNSWAGSFLILVMPMCLLQILSSAGASHMVQTAPMRKKLETAVPAIINFLYGLFGYAVIVLIKVIQVKTGMYAAEDVSFQLLFSAGIVLLVDFYSGIAYKKYYLRHRFVFPVRHGLRRNIRHRDLSGLGSQRASGGSGLRGDCSSFSGRGAAVWSQPSVL